MSTRYRVTVERIDSIEGTQFETRETVLFEAVSPSLDRLLVFAPDEVAGALVDAGGRYGGGIVRPAETVEAEAAEPQPEEKPKRTRRTKAEMEAARAAEAAQVGVAPAAVQPVEVPTPLPEPETGSAGTLSPVAGSWNPFQ